MSPNDSGSFSESLKKGPKPDLLQLQQSLVGPIPGFQVPGLRGDDGLGSASDDRNPLRPATQDQPVFEQAFRQRDPFRV